MAQSFPETRWSLIQRVRCTDDETNALDEWCRNYWPPVYSYICAQGYDADDAKELAQSFFERLLTKGTEKSLPNQLSGAFRAYLMRAVKNFLTDQWRSAQSQRKGGQNFRIPPDELDLISDDAPKPDQVFDQSWALTIIELSLTKLEQEMTQKGHQEFFHAAKGFLDGRTMNDADRSSTAHTLGMKDSAFRVALHRLRRRFRKLIEEEIRETVSTEEEFQEELNYLFKLWS